MPDAVAGEAVDRPLEQWRPTLVGRITLVVVGLSALAMATAMTTATTTALDGGLSTAVLAVAVAGVALVGVALLSAAFMSVTVGAAEIVVRNLFWRSRSVPLDEVVDARAHATGIDLVLRDGTRLTCAAVQSGVLRRLVGTPDRGRRAAREIRRSLRR